MEYILTNGRIIYKRGTNERKDIWIRSGKIYMIHDNLNEKNLIKKIDITGYGLLPGFVYQSPFWSFLRNHSSYLNQMRKLINQGYTSFIDIIQWCSNYSISELIEYHSALHVNSPIDYTFRFYIPIQYVTTKMLQEISRSDLRHIILGINDVKQFKGFDWSYLYSFSQYYGISFSIYPHNSCLNRRKGKKEVERIQNYWYYLNHEYCMSHNHTYTSLFITNSIVVDKNDIMQVRSQFSSEPANRVGIYPQKGSISIGSDADLLVVSLNAMKQYPFIPHILFINGNLYLLPLDDIPIGQGKQLNTITSNAYR